MKRFISLLFTLQFMLSFILSGTSYAVSGKPSVPASQDFRAVWVATVLNLDYPSKPGVSVDTLKKEAVKTLDDALEIGMNAVILQVRPTGDAYYKSALFPWSAYLTGSQGTAPADGFDPLAFWVSEAHARGLELHAWINPFRITKGSESNPKHDVTALAASNPARKNSSWTVKYKDGNLYYDPGIPEVRKLVIDGVSEIVKDYAVDGIHYDDYFYPNPDFPDSASFAKYGKNYSDRNNWRRDNINTLVSETYKAVKAIRSDCRFGVSPCGVWANKKNSTFGSETNGYESFYSQFADTRKWVKSGWLDYIAPQIYWNIGYAAADYKTLLNWWADTVDSTNVDLYIGHATYRLETGKNSGDAWYGTQEIVRQTELNRKTPQVKGSIHFRYSFLRDNANIRSTVATLYNGTVSPSPAPSPSQSTPSVPITGTQVVKIPEPAIGNLVVGRPSSNISTTKKNYYVLGASDPSKPLTMNGKEVTGRTGKGYFGVYVDLKSGANTFKFVNGSQTVTRTITRGGGSGSSPTAMSKAEIVSGTAYPNGYDEYKMPGETLTLKCTAPIGSTVTVRLNGNTYTMKAATTTKPSASGNYPTTFSYDFKLPSYTTTGKVMTVGTPVYTMKLGSVTSSATATASIKCITKDTPYYAVVASDGAFIYPGATTSGGPFGELVKGQKDKITAITNGWVRLGMGAWIQRSDITRTLDEKLMSVPLTNASYTTGSKLDTFSLSGGPVSGRVEYDGKTLKWSLYSTKSGAVPTLPAGSPFASVTAEHTMGKTTYNLKLKDNTVIDGYYMSCTSTGVTLNIKRRLKLSGGSKPLSGLNIVLDAGHGGSESGAVGPLGSAMPEKTLNLAAATKLKAELESRGATVVISRTDDVTVSLNDRVVLNRNNKPDLFLSMHANSLDEETNASSIRGVCIFYRDRVSKELSEALYNHIWTSLSMDKRGCNQSNLYVCRPTWCPSIIVESGFMCNPADFEWLVSNAQQDKFVKTIADGIQKYFTA